MRDLLCGDVQAGLLFSAEDELRAYRLMLLIRRFEEKAGQLYALGAVRGPCHLAIGQEAVIAGLEMASEPGDALITGSRCHGALLVRGTPPEAMMAELMGAEAGVSRGRGGSIAMFDPERGVYGGHEGPAAQVGLAAGLAFAARYRKNAAAALCLLGDGAAERGLFYETLRLAAEWKLPLVLAIDNNTVGTEAGRAVAPSPAALSERGAAFGVPGETVDGIDVRKVRAAGRRALERVRRGEGPVILEMLTHPYHGHAEQAEGRRPAPSREERDPLAKARARIIADRVATDEGLKALENGIRDEIQAAVGSARAAANSGRDRLLDHVYASGPG